MMSRNEMTEPVQTISFQDFCVRMGISADCITNSTSASENRRVFTIERQPGDQVWRLKVDHCWLHDRDGAKTDYLFWCQSATGQKYIFLVELKGRDFSHALEQIEAMLARLCKKANGNMVHQRNDYKASPGHDLTTLGGIKAFVVLSQGSEVQTNQREIARIRQRYNVIIHTKSVKKEVRLPL